MNLLSRFDPQLIRLSMPILQDLAQAWGMAIVKNKTTREQCISCIVKGLKDPQQVRSRLEQLAPDQHFALQLAKQGQGAVSTNKLIMMLKLLEIDLPDLTSTPMDGITGFAQTLVKTGLFIPYSVPTQYLYGFDFSNLVTDERVLAQVDSPPFRPLSLRSTPAPAASSYRRPASITLSILGVMQAITDLGGIKITKAGEPQVNSVRKLGKTQQWDEAGTLIDGFWFPRPAIALIAMLLHTRLLRVSSDGASLELAKDLQAFAKTSQLQQVGWLLESVSEIGEWVERTTPSWFDISFYLEARQSLLLVLQLLPLDPEAWYSFDEFEEFISARIGDYFLPTGFRPMPYITGTPEQQAATRQRIQKQRRESWERQEKPWLQYALSTWLYFLGMVELGFTPDQAAAPGQTKGKKTEAAPASTYRNEAVISFRLTELGRSLLHPTLASAQTQPTPKPAWIVQPNFEILVYLDEVAPMQMVFLEGHCDRIDTQQYTVQYRITRESVYQGLERGGTLEAFLDGLKTGAKVPLPQNVEIDIQQWSQLREQVTLKRSVRLLEFTDEASRQAAIAKGIKGQAIGDRFLLITQEPNAIKTWINQKINYSTSLKSCLSITETGEVKQTAIVNDLLFETQLQRWVEPSGKKGMAITPASVAKAVKTGHKASDILDFLETRLTHAIPPLLKIALTAWAGRPAKLEMEEIIVLRCLDPVVFDAIASSKKLRSHFIGHLSPSLLLVDRTQLKKLNQDLEWLGLNPAPQLLNIPPLDD